MPNEKPVPYQFCEIHFKANCPICRAVAVPNPVLTEPPLPVTKPPEQGGFVQQNITPPPILTDPKAQKIVEAARKYALAVEAAAIIADQVVQAEELLAGLKKKLAETRADVANAMKETQQV
jgi:hypothetical protein